MATKKRPTRFRQGRRQGKVDAKKVFSGAAKAGLKDKDRFTKFSADDIEALNEAKEGSRKGFITDDKGNKIQTEKFTKESAKQYWEDVRKADKAAAKAEALRKYPYDADELKAMSKADRAAAETTQKRISEPKASSSGKPADRTASATQKVRSAVTVNEPKSQGYKVDKDGNKIKEPKVTNKSTPTKGGRVVQKSSNKTTKPEGKKLPVAKKGFAAGKELNAEGKAMYDKFIKEGIKPKSALNKALFRQEKGAKVAAKAAGPVATAAKSAASKVKKQGPVTKGQMGKVAKVVNYDPKTKMGTSRPEGLTPKVRKEIQAKYDAAVRNESGMTARQESALQRRGRKEDQRMSKLRAADPKKFDAREALARNTKITPAEYAKERARIGDTVRPKPAVAPKPGKYLAMQNAKKTSTSKELIVRPKPGAVATKAASSSAKKKFTAKGAALGAAKFAGKAVTGKVGMALTAATLLGKPVLQALTKDPQAGKKQSTTTTPAVKSRSNQPRITGQGKFIGVGAGGSTYKVNAGDTLSGIAKKSGVTLSELMAENKKIKDPRKIYRNTSINIPSKGKVPTGGYAGPVPYRPKKK
jgi:LysM repeat protein